jgi:Tfp pilus assembly protein PilE
MLCFAQVDDGLISTSKQVAALDVAGILALVAIVALGGYLAKDRQLMAHQKIMQDLAKETHCAIQHNSDVTERTNQLLIEVKDTNTATKHTMESVGAAVIDATKWCRTLHGMSGQGGRGRDDS